MNQPVTRDDNTPDAAAATLQKGCPFCGSTSLISEEYRATQGNPRVIVCMGCGATGPLFKLSDNGSRVDINDSVSRSIERWNERA